MGRKMKSDAQRRRPLRLAEARRKDGYFDADETYFETATEYMLGGVLGLCSCGRPEETLQYVRDGLALIKLGRASTPAERFFLHWADSTGFAEHGSTPASCWLTNEGEGLLADLTEALFPEDSEAAGE